MCARYHTQDKRWHRFSFYPPYLNLDVTRTIYRSLRTLNIPPTPSYNTPSSSWFPHCCNGPVRGDHGMSRKMGSTLVQGSDRWQQKAQCDTHEYRLANAWPCIEHTSEKESTTQATCVFNDSLGSVRTPDLVKQCSEIAVGYQRSDNKRY